MGKDKPTTSPHNDARFQRNFCDRLFRELGLPFPLLAGSSEEIVVQSRFTGLQTFIFLFNMLSKPGHLVFSEGDYINVEDGTPAGISVSPRALWFWVLCRKIISSVYNKLDSF